MNDVHYSSKSDEWETPQDLFDKLNDEFHFTLDAAATSKNSKCGPRYMDMLGDALTMDWKYHSQGGSIFLNPPYGRKIGKFVQKAYEESLKGVTVVCLIPARTDTRWFHDYCVKGEIRFLKGRLKFKNRDGDPLPTPAPFPSMVVVFK
jgi:site-specific DNA-methyltransferase (adenine-specific)